MFTTIISVEDLRSLSTTPMVVIDCRFNLADTEAGRTAYGVDHIPGAFYLHLDEDLSSPITSFSGRHPLPDLNLLAQSLVSFGITDQTQVVVYDDCAGAMAARAWWLIKCLGHEAVAVLDGGYPAWLSTSIEHSQSGHSKSSSKADALALNTVYNHLPQNTLSADQLAALLASRQICLVDARAAERFCGDVEPIDPVAGHIPGAVNRPLTDNIEKGLFKTPEKLREEWLCIIDSFPAEDVVHMCGSGVTACHNLLAMDIAGLKGSKVYAGSWSEWIRDPKRPIAKD
ncbi:MULTISPECIES: sulfurtransferase [unclassified Neptuniibacter]|uniref:sulfurtransferase n=1 Tax=unclassified Neptuniibacter TaxID=2630693 RepID=UPI000C482D9E|nr:MULTISPECIES: sulfurtransferase [unclassified Neptuniibacter]MAY40872.1 sulfurtransferase [Oceanospirillaceae bacterium]|tara:strand:+ start:15659 stop:16516 length:858 start_codon:yes stop_codon:yes gene_type:complete